MKKLFLFTFFLLSSYIFAQKNILVTYKISAKENETIINEKYNLHIENQTSIFYNPISVKLDSIKKEYKAQGNYNGYLEAKNNYGKQKIKYTIIKRNTNYKYVINELNNTITYEDDIPSFSWKIKNEFENILNYKCQKAVTVFKGKEYTAWFTKDIPINNGPYVFQGLPGLILKVSNDSSSIEVVGLKKSNSKDKPAINITKEIKTTNKDFYNTLSKLHKNIFQGFDIKVSNSNKTIDNKLNERFNQKYRYEF